MMDFQVIGALLSNVGIGAILAWYLWYTTSVAQPKHAEIQNEIIRRIVEEFRGDMALERNHRSELCDAIRELAHELRQRPCIAQGCAKDEN